MKLWTAHTGPGGLMGARVELKCGNKTVGYLYEASAADVDLIVEGVNALILTSNTGVKK